MTDHEKSRLKAAEAMDAELNAEMARRTDKLADNNIELALRVKQAREFLAWSSAHMRTSWLEWQEQANQALKDISQLRMALDRETKTATAAVKDIRDFFNSKEYVEAAGRMKDMLAMMEKLEQLKKDGVLDSFAEFILSSCK